MEKRRNCFSGNFSSFPQYFQYISNFKSQITHIFVTVVNRINSSPFLQIWYVDVRISRSISESPLEFEITRVDCIVMYERATIAVVFCVCVLFFFIFFFLFPLTGKQQGRPNTYWVLIGILCFHHGPSVEFNWYLTLIVLHIHMKYLLTFYIFISTEHNYLR